MNSQILRDNQGRKIGEIRIEESNQVIRDAQGRKLGYFDGQYTRDAQGRRVGEGNLLVMLLPR